MSVEKQEIPLFDQRTPQERLAALQKQMQQFANGTLQAPVATDFVNNHIHTIYSFSPYSPTAAAYTAWWNGLTTAGIMDHDSVGGAQEFVRAGKEIGLATTVGFECRCKMDKTPFVGKRINNPDQLSVAYVTCHGIPHQNLEKAQAWLAPLREKRNVRNRKMVRNINTLLAGSGLELDFERDVVPLSQSENGGAITERHILYGLAFRITAAQGKGKPVLDFLRSQLSIVAPDAQRELLENAHTPAYEYVLLGLLKSSMVEKFYIPAQEECPDVTEFVAFARSIGGIPAYAYLGDVGDSVTGDKKTQKFEDDYFDELVVWLAKTGFQALTYMPTRNTKQQLERVSKLCKANNLFQISGEDINSPSQSFICKALLLPEYRHLIEATWALIGHERAATLDVSDGMFSEKTLASMPGLAQRITHFAAIGKQ